MNIVIAKIVLVAALISSSLAVVYSTHLSRVKFNQLEVLKRDEGELLMRWRRLLLEEGALSSLARVEHMATQRMGMHVPNAATVQVFSP